ncbi:MAG: response regulator [Chloroflexi bacterium]|nr:response regulator [Chloroflexota bacterium]
MHDDIWALIVEADAHSLIAISNLLKELGIRYKRNTTGANVIEQIRRMQPRPHFILLDLDLPQGDARLISKLIERDHIIGGIPVIAIAQTTALDRPSHLQRSGFAGFIRKPLPRHQFGDMIAHVLQGGDLWEARV